MQNREAEQRRAVVAEARSWIRTPYHHAARVKGVGVDCAQILVGVFSSVGLIKPMKLPPYPPDWHLNRSAERYLGIILELAREHPGPPAPGDVALFQFGRCFSHGGIVTEWPRMVHAWMPAGRVIEVDVLADRALTHMGEATETPRGRRFFSYWGR